MNRLEDRRTLLKAEGRALAMGIRWQLTPLQVLNQGEQHVAEV
jgi:hypothetical protein